MAIHDRSFVSRAPCTAALLAVNISIYVLMALALQKTQFGGREVVGYGAAWQPLIWHGDLWRLMSSVFLHGGVFHLLMNMYFLYMIGPRLEQQYRTGLFALIYLGSGLGGSVAAVIASPVPVVGASGALMGVVGAMIGWGIVEHRRLKTFLRTPEGAWVQRFAVIMVLFSVFWGGMLSISHAGHIGGAVAGLAIGYYFAMSLAKRWKEPWHRIAAGAVIVAVLLAGTLYARYSIWHPTYEHREIIYRLIMNPELP